MGAAVSVAILQHPHPKLREKCEPVVSFDTFLAYVVQQMNQAIDGSAVKCLGLAANQIGETKRVIIVVQGGQRIAMVNPVITQKSGEQVVRDGCLSVEHGRVFRMRTRPAFVLVEYFDIYGQPQRRRAKGLHAAAIAHEIDHLDGVLFIDELSAVA